VSSHYLKLNPDWRKRQFTCVGMTNLRDSD
jgi:hypothetical protein